MRIQRRVVIRLSLDPRANYPNLSELSGEEDLIGCLLVECVVERHVLSARERCRATTSVCDVEELCHCPPSCSDNRMPAENGTKDDSAWLTSIYFCQNTLDLFLSTVWWRIAIVNIYLTVKNSSIYWRLGRLAIILIAQTISIIAQEYPQCCRPIRLTHVCKYGVVWVGKRTWKI